MVGRRHEDAADRTAWIFQLTAVVDNVFSIDFRIGQRNKNPTRCRYGLDR